MQYIVNLRATSETIVVVEADSEQEAVNKVEQAYTGFDNFFFNVRSGVATVELEAEASIADDQDINAYDKSERAYFDDMCELPAASGSWR